MNAAKRFLTVAVTFAVATLVFTIANPKAVHAFAATLVQVVNTTTNPVPTQAVGTTPVSGTVTLDPNSTLSVSSLPAVQVSNQPPDPALHAVMLMGRADMQNGDFSGSGSNLQSGGSDFTVPAGKRFVIQSVSLSVKMPTGQKLAEVGFSIANNGFALDYSLAPVFTGTVFGSDWYALSQQITAYVDAPYPVGVFSDRNSSTGAAEVRMTVAGYLVDCPNGNCPMQP